MSASALPNAVAVSGIWLRSIGDKIEVLAEIGEKWHVVIPPELKDGNISYIVEVGGMLSAPIDTVTVRPELLSRNEAMAILQEHGAPLDEAKTNRDVLNWCVEHRAELPYTPAEIMKAFFPTNPQNVRDTL